MLLVPPGRYKLTLAVKETRSEQIGTSEHGLFLPSLEENSLDASSIVLARSLQVVEHIPENLIPFVLGDFRVVPNVTRAFDNRDDMGVYLQVYNASIDQSTAEPNVEVEYQILREGKIVKSYIDPKKNSVLNYGDRLVLLQAVDLNDLSPGGYTLKVSIRDQINPSQELSRKVDFSVTGG